MSEVPTALYTSGADGTVDVGLADRFAHAHFPALEVSAYDKREGIPHQTTAPEVNGHFAELVESTAGFLGRGAE